jgi:hypothetical protein
MILRSDVGEVSMSATADQKMFIYELNPDRDLVHRIRKAEQDGQVVILLVDPWSICIKTYREVMEEYDKSNFENCAVLVAWNVVRLTKAQRDKSGGGDRNRTDE